MPVVIKIRQNGPYLVEGEFTLTDHEGNVIEAKPGKNGNVSLCRCGASSRKPFCDGTHSKIGFKGAEEAAAAMDASRSGGTPGAESDKP
jgi:CDGSH-type Zn-finger protein